jgi:F-type H+-transporting ATPase subunit b
MSALLSVSWGTVFWATLAFLIVYFLLKKYAWGPIIQSLDERSNNIESALNEAEKARNEIAKLQAGNEVLLRQARDERDIILRDAQAVKENIISEARTKAQEQASRIMATAGVEIENAKKAAMTDLKNYVATLSIEIAEKLLKDRLSDAEKQTALNNSLISEISKN